MWLTLAKRGAAGSYGDLDVFIGLYEAVFASEGVGFQNIKYNSKFDEFCTTMVTIAPAGFAYFRSEFGGRSLESMRYA